MKRIAVALVSALLPLLGCVSSGLMASNYYAIAPDVTARILRGELGAVALDLRTGSQCHDLQILLRNVDTGQVVTRRITSTYTAMQASIINAGEIPTVIALAPGRYEYWGGDCTYAGNYRTGTGFDTYTEYRESLDSMVLWLRPFEIHGGEVVYTGTAMRERYEREWGTIQEGAGRASDTYDLYAVEDHSDEVQRSVNQYNPSLGERFTNRILAPLLERDSVRQLISDSYDGEGGGLPSDAATAVSRVARARERVRIALAERLDQQLPHGADNQALLDRARQR